MQNFLLLTYDSCRYDVLVNAATPVLDSYSKIYSAQAPANFTYASHLAFFAGILPNSNQNIPYYNRFRKQLLGLIEVGENQVNKNSLKRTKSDWNLIQGLKDEGYRTVGSGAMNWFKQKTLTIGFEIFKFTGRDAEKQIDFLISNFDKNKPFFGFINFGETHAPYSYKGKETNCAEDVRARRIEWPPVEKSNNIGNQNVAYHHQIAAAEYLDSCLPKLFKNLPGQTIVVLTADHGECFGEDGYWGHGVNHPRVFEVPLAIFRLDREALNENRQYWELTNYKSK